MVPPRAGAKPVAARSGADVALIAGGLMSAAASIVFAAAMLTRGDQAPLVNGMQYLAIFGQPRLHAVPSAATDVAAAPSPATPARVAAAAAPAAPARAQAGKSIDFDPTGAIFHYGPDGTLETDPYRLVAVEPGMAWLRNSAEMRVVKPGDVAPGLGRIAAIVMRDGHWALVDDSGASLLTSEPEGAEAAKDPFSRRMIFGGED